MYSREKEYKKIIVERAIKYFSYDMDFHEAFYGYKNHLPCAPYVASEGDFSEVIEPIYAKLEGVERDDIEKVIDEALTHYDPLG